MLGTCAVGITYTLFYVLGTWSLSYGVSTLGLHAASSTWASQMISVFFFAAFILVGCLYRRQAAAARPVLVVATTLATLGVRPGGPACFSAAAHVAGRCMAVPLRRLRAAWARCSALAASYLPELFPANVRYSGAGLTYNLAAIVGRRVRPDHRNARSS